jgi:hypothetical protein
MFQINITCHKIFDSKVLSNIPKLTFLVRKVAIWQPRFSLQIPGMPLIANFRRRQKKNSQN